MLPSRNKLPREAVYSRRIAEDSTFIIVLSCCWATPKRPDPEKKLLGNVSEFLALVDVARHIGDFDLILQELNVGDREVLVNWDWSCLYLKKDGDITPLQLDSFKRGLLTVDVLRGYTGTLCLLCTEGHDWPGSPPDYKGSGCPYFDSLVSTLVQDPGVGAHNGSRTSAGPSTGSMSIFAEPSGNFGEPTRVRQGNRAHTRHQRQRQASFEGQIQGDARCRGSLQKRSR